MAWAIFEQHQVQLIRRWTSQRAARQHSGMFIAVAWTEETPEDMKRTPVCFVRDLEVPLPWQSFAERNCWIRPGGRS